MLLIGLLLVAGRAEEAKFDLAGQITPEARASVSLHGATSPFSASTLSDLRGRFQFRKLLAGAYTIGVFIPGRGEASQTIEVGPSLADAKAVTRAAAPIGNGPDLVQKKRGPELAAASRSPVSS